MRVSPRNVWWGNDVITTGAGMRSGAGPQQEWQLTGEGRQKREGGKRPRRKEGDEERRERDNHTRLHTTYTPPKHFHM